MITELDFVEVEGSLLYNEKISVVEGKSNDRKKIFHIAPNEGIYSLAKLNKSLDNLFNNNKDFIIVEVKHYTVTPQRNVRLGSVILTIFSVKKELVLEIILYPDSHFRSLVLKNERYREYIPGWRLR